MYLVTVSESDLKLQSFSDFYNLQSTQKHYLVSFSQRSGCAFICFIAISLSDHASLCHVHPCLGTLVSTTVSLPTSANWVSVCQDLHGFTDLFGSSVDSSTPPTHSSTPQTIYVKGCSGIKCTASQRVTAVQRLPASLALEAQLLLLNLSQTSLQSAV